MHLCLRQPALLLWFFLLAASLIPPGCGGTDSDPEEQAKAIYAQAKTLETQGNILGALKEYDRLAAYPETQTFAAARDELLKQGYSLGAGLESWTAKLLVEIENELVRRGKELNPQDGLVIHLPKTDAWGQYLWVEYSTGPKFLFRIMSAGPDGQPDTGDELALYHKPPHLSVAPPYADPGNAPLGGRSTGPEGAPLGNDPGQAPPQSEETAPPRTVSPLEKQELNRYQAPAPIQAPRKTIAIPQEKPRPETKPGSAEEQTLDLEELL
jgi:hypothetical protein